MMSHHNWPELLVRLEADLRARATGATATDEEAWERLAQALSYHASVLQFSYPDLQAPDIEDLIHDVLLKLQSIDTMRLLRAARSVEGYLFVTLRNAATDLLRQRKAKVLIGEDILESFDERDRQFFEMRFWRNMSIADIATDTNTPYALVASKLFKMVSQLRLQLGDLERRIYYEEIYQQLPMKVILEGFSEEEKKLLELNIIEELSAKEIAKLLDEDVRLVRVNLNALRSKLRYRARNVLQKRPEML